MKTVNYTLGGKIDKQFVWQLSKKNFNFIDRKFNDLENDVYHSLEDAMRVAANMQKGFSCKVKIKRIDRKTLRNSQFSKCWFL
jgi:hypothetical protein